MSAILHAGAFVLAILISIALIQTALAVPTWWMALMIAGLMTIPVALLTWADAPWWLIPLPLVAILVVLAFMLSAVAVEQHRRLQHLRRERDNARALSAAPGRPAAGWWDAPQARPTDVELNAPGDAESGSAPDELIDGDIDAERRAFDDLMRRNFAD